MSKRVANSKGKRGARYGRVRLGWRKARARDQLIRAGFKTKGGMLATIRRLFKRG